MTHTITAAAIRHAVCQARLCDKSAAEAWGRAHEYWLDGLPQHAVLREVRAANDATCTAEAIRYAIRVLTAHAYRNENDLDPLDDWTPAGDAAKRALKQMSRTTRMRHDVFKSWPFSAQRILAN